MRMIPTGNRVLVKPVRLPEQSVGGIIIPETARGDKNEATVVAVGRELSDGMYLAPPVKAGDHIIHGDFVGIPIPYEGEDHLILEMDHVLAIVT